MDNLIIKNTSIPKLGLGTWRLYGNECTKIVSEALAMGYRHIDTAQYYENEFAIGDAIKNSDVDREEIFLTTKISPPNMHFGQPVESVENSLRKLNVDYLDLLLLHAPPETDDEAILDPLQKLKEEGKVKHIGISNYYGVRLKNVAKKYEIFTNQIEWHPFVDVTKVRGISDELGIAITAYSPLARGKVMENSTILNLAKAHNKTPAQIVLRWIIQHDNTLTIPKSSSVERLRENMEIFDFTLSQEDITAINNINDPFRIVNGDWMKDDK